ncbi:hypothetical protein OL229_09160 [Neisseriaceae bacterium JH1-16]|nr:hypothetical protein [Neisseriaceae bacterium JH1-16]
MPTVELCDEQTRKTYYVDFTVDELEKLYSRPKPGESVRHFELPSIKGGVKLERGTVILFIGKGVISEDTDVIVTPVELLRREITCTMQEWEKAGNQVPASFLVP